MDLSTLRRTAAEIAAAALCEAYPNIELLGGGETSTGFYYDFSTPNPIRLDLIEEKIRQIVKERRPIRTLEMVAFSARELLKKEGHVARSEEVGEGLVEIIQIESFHDLSSGPHLKNTAELAAFKISLESFDRGFRIVGWAHDSKEGLKKFLKKISEYTDPVELGEKMGLWKGEVWLSPGLKMRQQVIQFFKKHWFSDAYEIAAPLEVDRAEVHRLIGKPKVAEIWGDPFQGTQIQISFFDREEKDLISCLQSIAKTLTILGFDHTTVSRGRDVDYVVEDGLGRNISPIQVKRNSRKGSFKVDFYFIVEIEKILCLLLEKNLMMVELENK